MFSVLHLKRLEAHGGAVPTVHDIVFTVVPQQAVGHVAPQLLGPPGHLLALQRRAAAHLDKGGKAKRCCYCCCCCKHFKPAAIRASIATFPNPANYSCRWINIYLYKYLSGGKQQLLWFSPVRGREHVSQPGQTHWNTSPTNGAVDRKVSQKPETSASCATLTHKLTRWSLVKTLLTKNSAV